MAGSKYAYVKKFELPDAVLPSTFMVVRLDGKGFTKFARAHGFAKPNDIGALKLMNDAAKRVVAGKELNGECVLAFGESDEYRKLVTLVSSLFTSAYVLLWPQYFPNSPIQLDNLPAFDGRLVQYTTETEVKDYFRWRQVDTHVNNLYNTCFWSLVLNAGMTETQAHEELKKTVSSQKNELLFSRFGINYSKLPSIFRKGSILVWESPNLSSSSPEAEAESSLTGTTGLHISGEQESKKERSKRVVVTVHEDLIADEWWTVEPPRRPIFDS